MGYNLISERSGFVLLLAVITITAIIILAASQFDRVANFVRFGANKIVQQQALNLADAGVDYALWQLNKTAGSWYGTGTEIAVTGLGTFFVTTTDSGPNIKTIQSTGYIPNSTNPREKVVVKVQAAQSTQTISFNYAVQVGTGGVSMANSASINGNVYSNGSITGSGSSTIYGDAWAVGTISSPDPLVTGTKNPGAPPSTMPSVNYTTIKDLADGPNNDLVTTCLPTCTISSSTNIGPRKYVGNLELTNNAIVVLDGPVWVTGNFSMSQGGTVLKLNENFGSFGTYFIVDGIVDLTQGGSFQPTSANPKGYIFLVTTSEANPALSISQSGATAVFYALEGTTDLSQTANVSSLVSKTLSMRNSSSLTYDTGLASAQFSSGPGGSWQILRGSYGYTK